jgi:TolB-like protein
MQHQRDGYQISSARWLGPQDAADNTTPTPAIRSHVDRILGSSQFAHSERISRFLRFAVEEWLAGRGSQLKEYVIGVEVFDRPASYDPRVDPIVRVEARRLRRKLNLYYETEGRAEAIRVDFPKGSYVPKCVSASRSPVKEDVVAVLPFTLLRAEPENERFRDGLAEELIHALTNVGGLRLAACYFASRLRLRSYDYHEIARQLNATVILDGRIRREGAHMRIMVQLVDTATGFYLWSEVYDLENGGVFAVQEQLAREIVNEMRIRLANRPEPHQQTQLPVRVQVQKSERTPMVGGELEATRK